MLRLGPQKGFLRHSGRAPARQSAQGSDGDRDQTMGSFRQWLKIGRVRFLRQPLAQLPASMDLRLQYVHRAEAIDPDYDGESTRQCAHTIKHPRGCQWRRYKGPENVIDPYFGALTCPTNSRVRNTRT